MEKLLKNKYEEPELEITKFSVLDVITASPGDDDDDDDAIELPDFEF